jgi:NAD(P)-dependent dehydrogenase (short-subunit alcohol dehydrogenase family)
MTLQNKSVVITGAGLGVGRALAMGFAKEGANVVGISRTPRDLQATAKLCAGRLKYVVGDVSVADDVENLFATAEREHGPVGVLINNAAVYPKTLFLEQSIEDWAQTIQINVIGMARCCHRALPNMLDRGYGRILNVGSFAWRGPIPTASAYSTSKGAVSALTRSIACEIDRAEYPDVLVNEFVPGIVRTRMTPDQGVEPASVFGHLRTVVVTPAGGPHGQTYLASDLVVEEQGSRLKRVLKRLLGRR